MKIEPGSGRIWTFAGRQYDDSRLELRVDGRVIDLELKPLEVLQQLLLHAGQVVTKESLLEAVWPGLTVVDSSLATAISKLRKALGDRDAAIVVNVPRVGYRLAADVQSRSVLTSIEEAEPRFAEGDRVPRRDPWRLVQALGARTRHVWLAEHQVTGARRVIKFAGDGPRLRSLKREVTVSRFLQQSLGSRPDLGHPVEWNFETPPYSVEAEYGGPNLVEWADRQGGLGTIAAGTRVRLLADVARVIAAAHDAGVVHKDLKPANVLVSPASADQLQVRVIDFGSATVDRERLEALGITALGLTHTADISHGSVLAGSFMYLPPEVFSGGTMGASTDVFALGVMLYQLAVGDLRRPLSAGWENDVTDPLLREDIALAACGDPARRLSTAAALADRLDRLEERRREREVRERDLELAQSALRRKADARIRRPWIAAAAVALIVAIGVSLAFYRRTSPPRSAPAVAVLPFQSGSPDSDLDFLRFALADQIATTLSRARPLTIRPSAASGQFTGATVDLKRAARELSVNRIVTGRYLVVADQLQITIEAVDTTRNELLWRDTLNVPSGKWLALQSQIAAVTRGKLASVLGAGEFERERVAPPASEAAYAMYLRSLALSFDPEPNKEGLALLERAVALDPTYAAAWFALSGRAYADARFGGGGTAMLDRSDGASEEALKLDPDYVDAAAELIMHRAERGAVREALRQAADLVRRRPDSAQAHHLYNYALRYAGLLEEAAQHCDDALMLEPEVIWGSCSSTFMELGRYARARDFLRKDLSSEWSRAHAVEILVREGKTRDAIRIGPPRIPHWDSYKMLLACAAGRPPSEIAALAASVEPSDDPEVNYFFSGHFAYCSQAEAALHYLQLAIDGNYCSFPAIDRDPLFENVRKLAEFAKLRERGRTCRAGFESANRPVG